MGESPAGRGGKAWPLPPPPHRPAKDHLAALSRGAPPTQPLDPLAPPAARRDRPARHAHLQRARLDLRTPDFPAGTSPDPTSVPAPPRADTPRSGLREPPLRPRTPAPPLSAASLHPGHAIDCSQTSHTYSRGVTSFSDIVWLLKHKVISVFQQSYFI